LSFCLSGGHRGIGFPPIVGVMRGVIFTICGHPEEIKRWVIGYGAHAEILEPEYLRKEVEKEIEKLQEIYHSDRK